MQRISELDLDADELGQTYHWIWAPDVMKNEADGKTLLSLPPILQTSSGCGCTYPRGPWKNVLGESEAVLVPDRFVKNAITLDGQTFGMMMVPGLCIGLGHLQRLQLWGR